MRFLKTAQGPHSVDSAGFLTRLDDIVGRGRGDTAGAEENEEESRPQIVKRRFWTPDEVEGAGSDEA